MKKQSFLCFSIIWIALVGVGFSVFIPVIPGYTTYKWYDGVNCSTQTYPIPEMGEMTIATCGGAARESVEYGFIKVEDANSCNNIITFTASPSITIINNVTGDRIMSFGVYQGCGFHNHYYSLLFWLTGYGPWV